MFVDLHIQPLGAQPLGAQPLGAQPLGAQPLGAQAKPRRVTTKIDQLRALMLAGGHLRDPAKGITLANLRTQRELAAMVGLRSHRNVSDLIRREFPEIAAMMDERQPYPDRESPKKDRFLWYVENGRHLRDPEGEPTGDNIKYQREIAADLGMAQHTVSVFMREYFPDIAAVMTKRSGRYRDKQAEDGT